MYVDGEQRNRKNGSTGTIDNNIPMTVGGKLDCDQVKNPELKRDPTFEPSPRQWSSRSSHPALPR